MRTRLFMLAGLLVLVAHSVSAQSRDPYFTTFSANYDFAYHELNETSGVGAHFDFATTIKRDVPYLGIMGEVGFNHFDGATVASFMGGPRLRIPNIGPHVLPFGQFLLGAYHCGACNIDDFAIQGGGGVDIKLSNTNDIRIRAQVDVRHTFDDFDSFNGVRVSGGVVFPLNR